MNFSKMMRYLKNARPGSLVIRHTPATGKVVGSIPTRTD